MANDLTTNEQMLDRVIRHSTYIERFSTSEVKRLIAELDSLDDDLLAQLQGYDPESLSAKRLQAMIVKVQEISEEAVQRYETALAGTAAQLGPYEAGWTAANMAGAIGAEILVTAGLELITPSENLVKAAINSRPLQGRLLKDWVADLDRARKSRLAAAIRMAAIESQTTQQLINRIRGTRANNYTDGILNISRNGAEAMARTAIQHVVNVSRELTYTENEEVIEEIQMVATLDGRTTPYCRAIDGKRFPKNKGPRPPFHIRCRTTTVPVLVSWESLGIEAEELEGETRASMNGQVPAAMNYDEWLRTQTPEFQDDVLGPSKAELFRGGLKLDRFVDLKTGRTFTLADLRALEPDLWESTFRDKPVRAGIFGTRVAEDVLPDLPADAAAGTAGGETVYSVMLRDAVNMPQREFQLAITNGQAGLESWGDDLMGPTRIVTFDRKADRDAWLASLPSSSHLIPVEIPANALYQGSRYDAPLIPGGRYVTMFDDEKFGIYGRDANGRLTGIRELEGSGAKLPLALGRRKTPEELERDLIDYFKEAAKDKLLPEEPDSTAYEHMVGVVKADNAVLYRTTSSLAQAASLPPDLNINWDAHAKGVAHYPRRSLDLWHNHPSPLAPLSTQDLVVTAAHPSIDWVVARDGFGNLYRARVPYFRDLSGLHGYANRMHGDQREWWSKFVDEISKEYEELVPIFARVSNTEMVRYGKELVPRRQAMIVSFAAHLAWRALDALGYIQYRVTLTGLAKELDDALNRVLAEEGLTFLDLVRATRNTRSAEEYVRMMTGSW